MFLTVFVQNSTGALHGLYKILHTRDEYAVNSQRRASWVVVTRVQD
jgi:hypothetical protein